MNKASLISIRNLDLAWARITTATNMQHKRMFRHLYHAYEPGRKPNLGLLHEKLQGAWKPTSPIRLYMPKASKLLRPLSLLSLDDQIVLQAIANKVAEQTAARRAAVERNVVFSNCLNPDPRSIFFLQDWRRTYGGFSTRLGRHLMAGNHWIAHFDLAAFYETISHRALQSIVAPSGGSSEVWKLIRDWLCVWTSGAGGIPVDHGIPQGPVASDFLAEVFLLPLDEAMVKAGIPYIRYVDDIRVLARTEEQVRRAAIILEMECRRWSLIPQSSKFSVMYAATLADALGTLPSIAESTGRTDDEADLDDDSAVAVFNDAVGGRPLRVKDKSRLRFVLYRAGASQKILATTLKLLPSHPEHIDAFAAYFQNYSRSRPIMTKVQAMLTQGVLYDYVEGELWLLAARLGKPSDLTALLPIARRRVRAGHLSFPIQRALLAFFLTCRNAGIVPATRVLNKLRTSTAYVQSLVIPHLADDDFERGGVVADLIEQHAPAAGMVLAEELVQRDISTHDLRLRVSRIPPETKNVFKGLGLIGATRNTKFDQIGDVIRTRFGLRYWRGWKPLLDANFQHALNLLLNADSKFYSDKSGWLASQNSFNDAVFRAFQKYLADNNLAGAMPLVDGSGQRLRTLGQLLDANAAFAREFTAIATALRAANDRRNRIPDSHPFETKGGKQTKHLQSRERDALKAQLATAYNGIMDFLDAQP